MNSDIVAHQLDAIPFELDIPALFKRVHVKEGSENASELLQLAKQGAQLARPKAAYLVAYTGERGDDFVEVEGLRFTSRVLSVNMKHAFRIFPYVATCGMELQQWGAGIEDMLHGFWAEILKEMALMAAMRALNEHIDAAYHPGETSSMSPGSLVDWPIQQQHVLFDLMGAHSDAIGVRLTDSLLMIPTKTVSGIRFPTTDHFESCQLCPRENCPGRRAPYEPALFKDKYE